MKIIQSLGPWMFRYNHYRVRNFLLFVSDEENANDVEAASELASCIIRDVKKTLNPTGRILQHLKALRIRAVGQRTEDEGSARMSLNDVRRIYGEAKTSKYSAMEKRTILRNWANFQADYLRGVNIKPSVFCNYKENGVVNILGKKNIYRTENGLDPRAQALAHARIKFLFKMYLHQNIEGRSLFSTYDQWTRLVCSTRKEKFSDQEVILLRHLRDLLNREEGLSRLTKEKIMITALERSRRAVQRKLATLDQVPVRDLNVVAWSRHREEQLVKAVIRAADHRIATKYQLRQLHLDNKQWDRVAADMGLTRTLVYNRWHYNLVPSLFPREWKVRADVQKACITSLRNAVEAGDVRDWKDVDWSAMSDQVGGYGALYCYRLIMSMRWNYSSSDSMRKSVSETLRMFGSSKFCRNLEKRRSAQLKGKHFLHRAEFNLHTSKLRYLKRSPEDDRVY